LGKQDSHKMLTIAKNKENEATKRLTQAKKLK
jgi:hypothetical protein